MSEQPISFKEAEEGIKGIYKKTPKDKLVRILHELSTVLSIALQKLRNLGLLEEFYDELDFNKEMKEHYEHLIKGVNLK